MNRVELGVHAPNLSSPPEAWWEWVRAALPLSVGTMWGTGTWHDRRFYETLADAYRSAGEPLPLVIARIGGRRESPEDYWRALVAALAEIPDAFRAEGRLILRVANEPNHPVEGWAGPEQYAETVLYLRAMCETHGVRVPLCLANLSLAHEWQWFFHRLVELGAADACEYVGLSLYRDDATDLERLGPYLDYARRTGQGLLGVEWNVDYERGERRVRWWRWSAGILAAAGIGALCVFIPFGVDHTGDWSQVYVLDEAELTGLAFLIEEQRRLPFGEASEVGS